MKANTNAYPPAPVLFPGCPKVHMCMHTNHTPKYCHGRRKKKYFRAEIGYASGVVFERLQRARGPGYFHSLPLLPMDSLCAPKVKGGTKRKKGGEWGVKVWQKRNTLQRERLCRESNPLTNDPRQKWLHFRLPKLHRQINVSVLFFQPCGLQVIIGLPATLFIIIPSFSCLQACIHQCDAQSQRSLCEILPASPAGHFPVPFLHSPRRQPGVGLRSERSDS